MCLSAAAIAAELPPLVEEYPILFTTRRQYQRDHHNTATLFQKGEINERKYDPPGRIKILNPKTGDVRTLVDGGPASIARDPELSWDGTKVIFSMRKSIDDDYHIYEINIDGTGLKQLTSLKGVSDIDPVYLPDGKIIFGSTREPKFCMCNRHIMANLFRMDGDGANIHQIGRSTLFEGHPVVLDDGRILYDRWEYVDRNFGDAQGLWVVNPDGTVHAIFYGNNTASPGGVIDARQIPGSHKVICVFGSCHDRPWGALAILDRNKGVDGAEPVEHIWPASARDLIGVGNFDTFTRVRPRYEDPFPLAHPETNAGAGQYFLCARTIGGDEAIKDRDEVKAEKKAKTAAEAEAERKAKLEARAERKAEKAAMTEAEAAAEAEARAAAKAAAKPKAQSDRMAIYLVDTAGDDVLVYRDPDGFGCFDPMPIMPRTPPRARPEQRDFENNPGTFYVQDVYEGTHMEGVRRGEVKFLRVIESPEKRSFTGSGWGGQGQQAPAMNWHSFENKRILGVAPVEEDGSAHFTVPSDTFVYFQLLDAEGRMIQSMRSGTIIQSGETQGCVGCHEDRVDTPPVSVTGLKALARPADKMGQGYGAGRLFNYLEQVQPVFDKHCVSCHDFDKPDGELVNLAGDKEFVFNASYVDLWRKNFINAAGAGRAEIYQAKSLGSHASSLTAYLDGHEDVKLSASEKLRVHTWMDLNAVYYPTYDFAYAHNRTGRSPLANPEVQRLEELTGIDFKPCFSHRSHPGAQVSFDRPEKSPCLKDLTKGTPEYDEALAIIRLGAENLRKTPRADMPGFVPAPEHLQRTAHYERFARAEAEFRKAIRDGRKLYDADVQKLIGE